MVQHQDWGRFDFDWVVVGSGFGGSVSALRLSEKGYRVAVLEAGRRFADQDFARSTWNLRRFLWMPALGLRGIMRIYTFKDVWILAGAGVGGGSLVYANTLYQPGEEFFSAPSGGTWRTGSTRSRPTMPRPSGCSVPRRSRFELTPTTCYASSVSAWASVTPTAVPRSRCSSHRTASRAQRSPIRSSTAKGPPGGRALAAARA